MLFWDICRVDEDLCRVVGGCRHAYVSWLPLWGCYIRTCISLMDTFLGLLYTYIYKFVRDLCKIVGDLYRLVGNLYQFVWDPCMVV